MERALSVWAPELMWRCGERKGHCHISVAGRGTRFVCPPESPDRRWNSPKLLIRYIVGKSTGAWSWLFTPSRFEVKNQSSYNFSLSYPFLSDTGHFTLHYLCPYIFRVLRILMTISDAARFKAWVCGLSFSGFVSSNPTAGIDVCLLWVLCAGRYMSLRRADQ
jgi:hypothetical protein